MVDKLYSFTVIKMRTIIETASTSTAGHTGGNLGGQGDRPSTNN